MVIGVTQPLVKLAADLALNYDLRGFDAIHLASALLVRLRTMDPVRLLAWDRRLANAALTADHFARRTRTGYRHSWYRR